MFICKLELLSKRVKSRISAVDRDRIVEIRKSEINREISAFKRKNFKINPIKNLNSMPKFNFLPYFL